MSGVARYAVRHRASHHLCQLSSAKTRLRRVRVREGVGAKGRTQALSAGSASARSWGLREDRGSGDQGRTDVSRCIFFSQDAPPTLLRTEGRQTACMAMATSEWRSVVIVSYCNCVSVTSGINSKNHRKRTWVPGSPGWTMSSDVTHLFFAHQEWPASLAAGGYNYWPAVSLSIVCHLTSSIMPASTSATPPPRAPLTPSLLGYHQDHSR